MSNPHPSSSTPRVASIESTDGRQFVAYQAENSVFLEELREDGRRTKRSVIEFPIDVVVSLASRIGLRPTAPAPVVPITGVMPIIKSGIA